MNIFFLDWDTELCAQYHTDSHCVKMILETAQLLSTAHRQLDGVETVVEKPDGKRAKRMTLADPVIDELLYKSTHKNHPSAVWVRESSANYRWTAQLLANLCEEYSFRYGRVHLTESKGIVRWLKANPPKNIPQDQNTPVKLAMPDEYKRECPIASYRAYYAGAKKHLHTWKNRGQPAWLELSQ